MFVEIPDIAQYLQKPYTTNTFEIDGFSAVFFFFVAVLSVRTGSKVTGYLELYDFIYVYIYATKTGILKS